MPFDPSEKPALMVRIKQAFTQFIPHNRALDMQFEDFEDGIAILRLPYRAELVGNPETGVLHGGTLTSLLDAASGASVFMRLWKPIPIATLDLRIDYLKPASPGRDVLGKAHCYKLTRQVAFVRSVAYHDDESDPIATGAGTFMVATKGRPGLGRALEEGE